MPSYSEKVIHNDWQITVPVLSLIKMKTKWTSYNEQQRNLELQAIAHREQKQTRYLEWLISASIGASLALGFVLIHQIFFV